MINPFNYVPVKVSDKSVMYASAESRWGFTTYRARYELAPIHNIILVNKKLYNRILAFLKPIEGQYELQKIYDDIVKTITLHSESELKEKEGKVREQWKERLSHSGGNMCFQFNAKDGIFGDKYIRQIVVHSDMYEAPLKPYNESKFEKTSYLNYFVSHYGAKIYCGIKNFINRRKIQKDKEQQLKENGFYGF